MAAKAKKKTNFWQDPTFQLFYNPLMMEIAASNAAEQNRLNTAQKDVYGARGSLAQSQTNAMNDKNRLAEEMAYRGGSRSGIYLGREKGLGTVQDANYANQTQDIIDQYNKQIDPATLLQKGLKMNANGTFSPIAEGETIVNPATGKSSIYNLANTYAGNLAKSKALAQYVAAKAQTKVS
jgi:hypothetical protein